MHALVTTVRCTVGRIPVLRQRSVLGVAGAPGGNRSINRILTAAAQLDRPRQVFAETERVVYNAVTNN